MKDSLLTEVLDTEVLTEVLQVLRKISLRQTLCLHCNWLWYSWRHVVELPTPRWHVTCNGCDLGIAMGISSISISYDLEMRGWVYWFSPNKFRTLALLVRAGDCTC